MGDFTVYTNLCDFLKNTINIKMLGVFFVISTYVAHVSSQVNDPVVQTPLGWIEGSHQLSFDNRTFSAFVGIPYAQAPIGKLRFKDPIPIEPWLGTWKANFLSHCMQLDPLAISGYSGDEDCLYLNVYVPRENPNPLERLEVIVHIHGGSYLRGSGHSYAHPEFLMDHDVIFVTMNYRLGLLGFLSTEDDVITGNFGLKDQNLALKWIQENIESFGGNPDSVTLTGLSSGGGSVHYHYLSPLSTGLFHRGFSQSGTVLNPWDLQEEPLERSIYLAEYVGCPTHNQSTQEILDCLQQKPAKQLLNATKLFYGFRTFPPCPFAPVIEHSSNPFINKHPYEMLANGEFQDLPWIDSVTSEEGRSFVDFPPDVWNEINENFTDLSPYLLDYNYTVPKTQLNTTAQKIKQHYLQDNQEINLADAIGDRYFVVDAEKAAKIQAQMSNSSVYFLYFNYALENSQLEGADHGDDAIFLFYNAFGSAERMTANDYKVKDIMVDMLVSYAKTGEPQIPGLYWPPTQHEEITYLNLSSYEPTGNSIGTVENISPVSFWNSLGILENENAV